MHAFRISVALLLASSASSLAAQEGQAPPPPPPQELPRSSDQPAKADKGAKDAAKKAAEGRKVIQAALNAGNTKIQAKDYDGAIADYKAGVAAAPPGHVNLFELHQALSIAYRGRGLKTFNDAIGPGVTQLPAAVKTAAGNDYRASLEEAGAAAAIAGSDQAKLDRLAGGMRESARLWAIADKAAVEASARSTLDLEARLFDQWTPSATPQQLTQFTPGLASALLPKDKDAALRYADAMFDKQPTDMETVASYGQIVADAKLPPADPRRVKAKKAVVDAITNGTTNDSQKARLRNARIQLEAAT